MNNSIKIIIVATIIISSISGCVDSSKPQRYVSEKNSNDIIVLNPDHTAISIDPGGHNFAGKYTKDGDKITITYDFMGFVQIYTLSNNTLIGPEPKKDVWILSK